VAATGLIYAIDRLSPALARGKSMSGLPPADPSDSSPLGPPAMEGLGRLELHARQIVEGLMAGLHRSPFKGFSVEFAEHRQYGPGDEIRHIDWRTYGKTDRYYVKEYEEETNLRAEFVVDTSRSMAYAGGGGALGSKLDCARRLAASLAYLLIGQRDAVGLVTSHTDPRALIPPRAAPGQFAVVCRALEQAGCEGERPLSDVLATLAPRIRRRGMVVILSDAFDAIEPLRRGLQQLRHGRHEVVLFQVLAPDEETLPFRRPSRFRDLEAPERSRPIDPQAWRAAYLERFHAHNRALADACREAGADYHRVSTAADTGRVLLDYLASRSGRAGAGAGAGTGSIPSEAAR
jgi:uncharacterized protein (DUF58 family)